MKQSFDLFIGIDWSGDKNTWQKGLKIAQVRPGSLAPELVPGPGPKQRWSRAEAAKWIVESICKERALIGLDFAFAFPPCGLPLDWEYVERLCCNSANFYGGEFFSVPSALHSHLVNCRSRPRVGRFVPHFRATEDAARLTTKGAAPQSIFNAIGPAQVGPSSISGMRVLRWLRQSLGQTTAIWPFDELDNSRSFVVEIFPRYFALSRNENPRLVEHANLNAALRAFDSAPVEKPPASEDEGDALLSAAALRSLSLDETIFVVSSEYAKAEGWIFGIPCNDDPFSQGLTPEQSFGDRTTSSRR